MPVVERGRLVGVLSRSVLQRRLAEDEEPRSPGRRMTVDRRRARPARETPGCEGVVHLNNAGASLMPDVVLQTVIEHLELEARIGGYEAAAREEDRVEAVYDSVARLLGCSRDEVAIVENATRAWDMAFYSFDFQPGDRILTCGAEYASNYIALLQVAQRTGAVVVVVGDDESGQVSLDRARGRSSSGARGSSRSSTCPRRAG